VLAELTAMLNVIRFIIGTSEVANLAHSLRMSHRSVDPLL
jgi:hypothetical protein